MSAAEFALWHDYHRRNGFPADRIEWAVANGAAYVGGAWGGKAKPADIVPRFTRRRKTAEEVKAWFDSLTSDRFKGTNAG